MHASHVYRVERVCLVEPTDVQTTEYDLVGAKNNISDFNMYNIIEL